MTKGPYAHIDATYVADVKDKSHDACEPLECAYIPRFAYLAEE